MKKLALVVMMLALCVGISYADPVGTLLITDGTNWITVGDNGACSGSAGTTCLGDLNPSTGGVILNGTVGAWTLNNVTGTFTKTGSGISFDLNSANVTATTGATLDIYYLNNGVTGSGGAYAATFFANNVNIAATFTGYFNNADQAFGIPPIPVGTVPGTAFVTLGPTTMNFLSAAGSIATDGSYSLTEQIHLLAGTGGGSTSLDGRITIPEPASMSILGAGLIGLAGLFRRKLAK